MKSHIYSFDEEHIPVVQLNEVSTNGSFELYDVFASFGDKDSLKSQIVI